MSDKADFTVLSEIFDAFPHHKVWDGGRYASRDQAKAPATTLRSLSERGLIEVETRRCSAWNFGPKSPPFYKPLSMTTDEWNRMNDEYAAFEPQRRSRKFTDRSEVVAHITDKGIEYLEMLRPTRIGG